MSFALIQTVALLLLLGAVAVLIWELHDIYAQTARLIFAVEKLHHMIWGALGTPTVTMPSPEADPEGIPSEPGKIYFPDGWGEEQEIEDEV